MTVDETGFRRMCVIQRKYFDFVYNSSLKVCAQMCTEKPECTHFNWNGDIQGGACYLNNGTVTYKAANYYPSPHFWCGIVSKFIESNFTQYIEVILQIIF